MEGSTGRVWFKETAYRKVCKLIGLNYHTLTKEQKFFLKADMITQYMGDYRGVRNKECYLEH